MDAFYACPAGPVTISAPRPDFLGDSVDRIQFDAEIRFGCSSGALLNLEGKIVGIVEGLLPDIVDEDKDGIS